MTWITDEIARAKNTLDTIVSISVISSSYYVEKEDQYWRDSYVIYTLLKALEYNEAIEIFDEDELYEVTNRLKEYYYIYEQLADAAEDWCSSITGDLPPNGGGETPVEVLQWYTYIIPITADDQVVFVGLPFNIDDVDEDSLLLTIDGDDPIYGATNDYHMEGTSLIWHYINDIYKPKIGMQMTIKWQQ